MARTIYAFLAAHVLGYFVLVQSQTATTTSAGSVFTVPSDADVGQSLIPNIIDPEAVDPQSVCPGYTASNVVETANGITADLSLAGAACNVYGNDIADLTLTVEYQAVDRLHVEIQPKYIGQENQTWFILPEEILQKPGVDTEGCASESDLDFTWSNDPTFSFKVTRNSTGDVLFSTEGTKLVYEDQFIEFKTALPENYNLYGLGEVIHGLRLGNNLTRTLFAADVGDNIDANIYGHHPVYYDTRYFEVDDAGKLTYAVNATDTSKAYKSYTHGVFQRNAHSQEVLLREPGVTWRALGGEIDLYFFEGATQDAVSKSYQKSIIGLPAFQQWWTFGYHQCRWGYNNWTELQGVVDDFAKFEIPLETIWNDIDYMNQYRDFDNDAIRYPYDEGAEFLSKLHANGQHYVPIVDSAIYAPNPETEQGQYPIYDRGVDQDAFLLNPDGSLYIGAVWPGYTVFPDWVGAIFNDTGANRWWTSEFTTWYDKVKFDGIWIDMSEVSSFCVGSCGSGNLTLNPVHPPFQLPGEPGNKITAYPEGFNVTNSTEASAISTTTAAAATTITTSSTTTTSYLRTTPTPGSRNINYPPYTINNFQGVDLAVHAVSPNATHHGGTLEYDFHNVFGHQILNATYHALLDVFPDKRPFIIGRSQFAGSGKWAGHWGGDNYSLWAFMFFSIPQALSNSLFGFPMFGPDTCGFNGNTDMELCARWMQLSAFFPFYRNHNVLSAIPQEPYRWEAVADASKVAMKIRYALLPYLYTTFYLSHSTGSTTMRALAWDFPDEPWLADADRQFLLGDAILVTPVLEQGASTVDGVFPGVGSGTVWYDWYNQTAITGVTAGQNVTIDAPLGHIPVYVKGGKVVPLQEPGLTTAAVRNSSYSLLVALDGQGKASGGLYIDDGESLKSHSTWIDFKADSTSLIATPKGDFTETNTLANVTVLGVQSSPSVVQLNGQDVGSLFAFDTEARKLSVTGLDGLTQDGAWGQDWTLTWT
ncbi:family 31 glycosyl hydrolase [Truncatella angustata]|uniref:alpha-glucosidase n=1 Tax=Truncatella angustata TaxID=152316 RepID=A0A9P8US04_9PEZI|nr:family 31 glycosyl hydrolase [Truncatella angustata]KAH6657173.1 family 31 glycosyl hydrolase [Truncatella angustata]